MVERLVMLLTMAFVVMSCDYFEYEYPKKVEWTDGDIVQLSRLCTQLASCIGKPSAEIVSQGRDSNHPFICRIGDKPGYGTYFMPIMIRAEWHDDFDNYFKQHITVCEMITKTGDYSKESIEANKRIFENFEERRKKREADQRKWEQERLQREKEDKELLDKVVTE